MKNSIFKTVVMGALFGALLFFMPFFIIGMFVCFGIFGFMMRRRMKHMGYGYYQFVMADKIRNMNEEEYQNFKHNMQHHRCGQYHNQNNTIHPIN